MQIRYKFLIPAAVALVVLGLATAGLATMAFSRVMRHRVSDAHEAQIEAIRREVTLSAMQAMELATAMASRPGVIDAYREASRGDRDDPFDPAVQRAREQLRDVLAPALAAYESTVGPEPLRLHFHLPNARSFLRAWREKQALRDGEWIDISDDLASFRRTVVEVNRTGKPTGGIELGRGGFTIRGVVPVRDAGGEQVGSAEVLRPFGAMLSAQLSHPGTHFAVLMDSSFLQVTTDLRDPRQHPRLQGPRRETVVVMADADDVVSEHMDLDLLADGRDGIAHAWSEPYFASTFPVHDTSGQLIGVVWLATNEHDVLASQSWFRQRLAVVTTLLIGVMAALLIVIGHRVCQPLRETSARLAEIASGEGDLSVRLQVHGRDETSELAALFNSFMQRLQESFTELTRNTARIRQMVDALPVDGDHPTVTENPEPRDVRTIAEAIDQTDAIIAGVEESLAAVQRAEEARRLLAAVVRSSRDAIMAVSLDGRVLSWNRGGELMYGYSSEQIVGDPYARLLPEADTEQTTAVLQAIAAGEPFRQIESDRKRSDGSSLLVSVAVSPIRGADGELTGASVIERDISKRKEAERAAEAQRRQLMQADRLAALGTLVAGVAHEISNPTSSITVNAPVVRDLWSGVLPALEAYQEEHGDLAVGAVAFDVIRESVPTLLDDIAVSAARIDAIVKSLKDFARRDAPAMDEAVDINEVVRSALTLTRNRIQKATLDLAVDLSDGLPTVQGSSQRIEQVIVNLILNACDALESTSQGIRIATALTDNGWITITVADEGAGIPSELLDRIRDPFFTTKRDSGGTGLGLSISTGIVEDHGGTLELTSEEGHGTAATISLPTNPASERSAPR